MKRKEIIPLSKFPTEAIVYLFRKNRHCDTQLPWDSYQRYNSSKKCYEWWVPFFGKWETEGGTVYDPVIIGYTLMSAEEVQKKFTTTHGNWWEGWNEPGEPGGYRDKMSFEFEKMYWEGTVQDVYDELSGRPHVDIHGSKDFCKWKIEYKKRLKG